MATTNPQAQIQAALMPPALPQTLEPFTTKKRQVQYTQYDPQSVAAYNEAMDKVAPRASTAELLANALAGTGYASSYEGAYGTQVSNSLISQITNALQGFGGLYGARKQQEREYLTDMLNAERERARIQMEMGKKNITEAEENGVMKVNTENSPEALAEKFAPENITRVKELNDKAGRWINDWAKGISDIANTERSQAYNEFEGLAKQYVQDQLRKMYGAQFTESEGERFFQSMGLSPKLDPDVRWRLVENALTDVARKNGLQMPKINASGTDTNNLMNQFMNGTI